MLEFASGIFSAILPCLAYENNERRDIRKTAQAVNTNMFELISSKAEKEAAFQYLDLASVMKVLQQYLTQGSVDTKVAVLKWIHHLFTQAENEVKSINFANQYRSIITFFGSKISRCQRMQSAYIQFYLKHFQISPMMLFPKG